MTQWLYFKISQFSMKIFYVCLLFTTFTHVAYSYDNNKNINFYLDCEDCDKTFIQQELDFVSFVRNPLLSDVHVLVTISKTGGGGRKYFLEFIGKKDFEKMNYLYEVITNQSDTEDDIRNKFIKTFSLGILQYYFKTDLKEQLNINIESKKKKVANNLLYDPWNKWIYSVEAGGEFQREESQNEFSMMTEAKIKKTTKEWKGSLEASYEINKENYYKDEKRITNKQNSKEISARFIKSLTNKWSARVYGEYLSTSYRNINHQFENSAAIEYNIFPWDESHRRILALRYNLAFNHYNYIEETIYDKMKESLFSESIEVDLNLIKPWGELSVELEAMHYFQDLKKYKLSFESDLSVRLSKNISVFFKLESDIIHDQLYLPKGDISLEDLLLERRKLATSYEINGRLGIRFTFGSIYNNVVNERF